MATTIEFGFNFRNRRFQDAAKGLRYLAKELQHDWDGMPAVLSAELKDFLTTMAMAISERHSRPYNGRKRIRTLARRSGALTQSILDSVRVEGSSFENLTGYIGAAFPGTVHEYGATIRPKKAKYLTVPLPAALDKRGIPKKRSAREWENTFVAKSKAGNLIIFQRRRSRIVPLYVLRTEVTIPPRLGMRTTIEKGLPYFVDKAADAMVRAMLKQGGLA